MVDKGLAAERGMDEDQPLSEEREKIGIIISNLEDLLTEGDSFWNAINAELGIPVGEGMGLYEKLLEKGSYPKWIKTISANWKQLTKTAPSKVSRQFFNEFYKKHLRVREGARAFVEYCEKDYDYYVISEAPWEFCLLAKEQLGFHHYYALTIFPFDRNNLLMTLIPHEAGFKTEKIMEQLIRKSKFSVKETVVISNQKRDINMIKQAGFGISVGLNISALPKEPPLNPNISSLPDLNFDELRIRIDRITEAIKQAKQQSLEKRK